MHKIRLGMGNKFNRYSVVPEVNIVFLYLKISEGDENSV